MTNTEQKHTPGPWTYDDQDGPEVFYNDGTVQPRIAMLDIENTSKEQAEGDGRLIAASANAFIEAAARLGFSAVEFAERMQDGGIAEMVEVLDVCLLAINGNRSAVDPAIRQDAEQKVRAVLAKIKGAV